MRATVSLIGCLLGACAPHYRTAIHRVAISPETLAGLEAAQRIQVKGAEQRVIDTPDGETVTVAPDAELVILTPKRQLRFRDPSAVAVDGDRLRFSRGVIEGSVAVKDLTGLFLEERTRILVATGSERTARTGLAVVAGVAGLAALTFVTLLGIACCVPIDNS